MMSRASLAPYDRRVSGQLSDGITVADIVGIAHLRLRVLGGAAGLERRVSWAHVFDNPNPWDWLDPTVLVMTSGWIVPEGPAAQATFIERMAEAGLSGLIVGDDPHLPGVHVPVLTTAMIEAADRVALPLLAAYRHTSWIEISQLVARANQAREGRTLNLVMRVHECVRRWLANPGASSELLDASAPSSARASTSSTHAPGSRSCRRSSDRTTHGSTRSRTRSRHAARRCP